MSGNQYSEGSGRRLTEPAYAFNFNYGGSGSKSFPPGATQQGDRNGDKLAVAQSGHAACAPMSGVANPGSSILRYRLGGGHSKKSLSSI